MSRKNKNRLTLKNLIQDYSMTRSMVDKFLPPPLLVRNHRYRGAAPLKLWDAETVEQCILENEELQAAISANAERLLRREQRRQERIRRAEQKQRDAVEFLSRFAPVNLIEEGRQLERHFVLHIGPTNSGKTHQALESLKKADAGAYLGPLRLLALEVAERLNEEECPCSLLTGEEYIPVKGAALVASTVELLDLSEHYEVCVIDEAQLIADPFRGNRWLLAICTVDASLVHICLAPEAEYIITELIRAMGASYDVVYHRRLVPLEYAGTLPALTMVQPGDALIAFSRRKVLQIAAELERKKIRASVIYGSLPPAARREEVRRFVERETTVVVATDAIGMGVSLPIRRVVFTESRKFDGEGRRSLTAAEVKQIAGRAGRFGKYDLGEVLKVPDISGISAALGEEVPLIQKVVLGFPGEAVDFDYPLMEMLRLWNELPSDPLFVRTDMSDAMVLLGTLLPVLKTQDYDKHLIFALIQCPVDVKNTALVDYWLACCLAILRETTVPSPWFREDNLQECELKYKAYDVYHQMLRRIGVEDDCMPMKAALTDKINLFLQEDKKQYLRKCRVCGRTLPVLGKYDICDRCFRRERQY